MARLTLILALVISTLAVAAAPAAASKSCGTLTYTGVSLTNTRSFGLPCSLAKQSLREYILRGLPPSIDRLNFRWHGQRAGFLAYLFYSPFGEPNSGKTKGGTRVGGRVPYYGTAEWRGYKPLKRRPSPGRSCGRVLISKAWTTIRLIRGVTCSTARSIATQWGKGKPLSGERHPWTPNGWRCFMSHPGQGPVYPPGELMTCGAGGAGDVALYRRAFYGLGS